MQQWAELFLSLGDMLVETTSMIWEMLYMMVHLGFFKDVVVYMCVWCACVCVCVYACVCLIQLFISLVFSMFTMLLFSFSFFFFPFLMILSFFIV